MAEEIVFRKLQELENRLTILETKAEERHLQSQDRHNVTYQKMDDINRNITSLYKTFDGKLSLMAQDIIKSEDKQTKAINKVIYIGLPAMISAVIGLIQLIRMVQIQ